MAATRVFDLRAGDKHHFQPRKVDWTPKMRARETLRWLAQEPAIATMVFVSVLAGTAQIVAQTLAPRYVAAALGVDPTNAVYVFAPSSLGLAAALYAMPRLVRAWGERNTTLLGFTALTLSLLALGAIRGGAGGRPIQSRAPAIAGGPRAEREAADGGVAGDPAGFRRLAFDDGGADVPEPARAAPLPGPRLRAQEHDQTRDGDHPADHAGSAAEVWCREGADCGTVLAAGGGLRADQLSRHYGGHSPRRGLDVLATYWEEPADAAPAGVAPASAAGV